MLPSTTQRAGDTHSTSGPRGVTSSQAALFVVALLPSNTPARAAMLAPVQTVIRYFTFGYASLTRFTTGSISSSDTRTPCPPGTMRTSTLASRDKKSSKVEVGTTDWAKVKLEFTLLETGSRVSARSSRVPPSWKAAISRTPSGPKTSSGAKPGKRTMA